MTYPIRPAITPCQVLAYQRAGNLGSALAQLSQDEYESTIRGFVVWLDTVKGYNPYHECILRTRWQELIDEQEGGDNEQE
jgi:hypothetical protein